MTIQGNSLRFVDILAIRWGGTRIWEMGGSDKGPPKAVSPRGVWGHAPPENF